MSDWPLIRNQIERFAERYGTLLRIELFYYVGWSSLEEGACDIWEIRVPEPYQFMENWLPSHSQ